MISFVLGVTLGAVVGVLLGMMCSGEQQNHMCDLTGWDTFTDRRDDR